MAVLNWYDGTQWVPLYAPDITKRLVKYKNLSDVTNVQDARTNLGLIGDNNHTHYHDDRYMPVIEQLRRDMQAQIDALRGELHQFQDDVAKWYHIGPSPQWGPMDNGSIWFDTSSRTIKVYSGGQWKAFSGVYLNI